MFEVGFSELCMVGLVALLVIGPEQLPKIARLAGFWLGKTRSMVASVKAEIKAELQAEEMRQLFNEQQADLGNFQEMLEEVANKANAKLSASVEEAMDEPLTPLRHPHEPK
jgi:sec-independent protein translocase protein TatB